MQISTDRLEPGCRVGEWVLERPLGQGGHAEVWAADHAHLDRRAALKLAREEAYLAHLRREISVVQRIDHPAVLPVVGCDLDGDLPHVVFPLVEGGSLRDLLEREGRLATRRAIRVARQVLGALEAAHAEGVLHLDLKPENVLVRTGRNGEEPVEVVISDFGLGRHAAIDPELRNSLGTRASDEISALAGTLPYLPPEATEGAEPAPSWDIHAAGVLLHEMVTDRASPLRLPVAGAPEAYSAVVERATASDPTTRYADARAMRADLPLPATVTPRPGPCPGDDPEAAADLPRTVVVIQEDGGLRAEGPPVRLHHAGPEGTAFAIRVENRTDAVRPIELKQTPRWLEGRRRTTSVAPGATVDLPLGTVEEGFDLRTVAAFQTALATELRASDRLVLRTPDDWISLPVEASHTDRDQTVNLGWALGLVPGLDLIFLLVTAIVASSLKARADRQVNPFEARRFATLAEETRRTLACCARGTAIVLGVGLVVTAGVAAATLIAY